MPSPFPEQEIRAAADRYAADHGVSVAEEIGSDEMPLIELFLIVNGYLGGEPTLVPPADN